MRKALVIAKGNQVQVEPDYSKSNCIDVLIVIQGTIAVVVGTELEGGTGLIESLIQRGKDLLNKMKEARDVNSILEGLRIIGNLSVSEVTHQDREFLRTLCGQVMNMIPKPLQDVLNEYYRWYLDCRNFFAVMKWNFDKRVKDFEEIINAPSSLGEVKPETILEGQIGILSSIMEKPPRIDPVSISKAVALVVYISMLFVLNLTFFPILEASLMASIVTIELGILALLPTLENWVRNR